MTFGVSGNLFAKLQQMQLQFGFLHWAHCNYMQATSTAAAFPAGVSAQTQLCLDNWRDGLV